MAEEVKKTSEPKVVSAKKTVTMEDVKFNEANKTKAILACFGFVGLIMLLIEKDDQFVRYMGAQFAILTALPLILYIIPFVGLVLGSILYFAFFVLTIIAAVKVSKGERFDVPVVKDWALKLINAI